MQLQVDRQSRELFSRESYSSSTFTLSIQNFHDGSAYPADLFNNDTSLWVRITNGQNRAFLYDITKGFGPPWLASLSQWHSSLISHIYIDQLSYSSLDLSQGCASKRAHVLQAMADRRWILKEARDAVYSVNYQDHKEVDVHGKPIVKWTR